MPVCCSTLTLWAWCWMGHPLLSNILYSLLPGFGSHVDKTNYTLHIDLLPDHIYFQSQNSNIWVSIELSHLLSKNSLRKPTKQMSHEQILRRSQTIAGMHKKVILYSTWASDDGFSLNGLLSTLFDWMVFSQLYMTAFYSWNNNWPHHFPATSLCTG